MEKNFLKTGIIGLSLLFAGVLLNSCSSDDNESALPKKVTLTVTASTGDTRTALTEAAGTTSPWTWSTGDKIYVVSASGVVGTLDIATAGVGQRTAVFSGSAAVTDGESYRFWYAGSSTLADNATTFSLDLSSQTGNLADLGNFDIMTGAAQVYVDGTTAYANNLVLSKLMCNACFNVTSSGTPTALSVSGTGIYSSVTFNLTTGLATGKSEGTLTTTSVFGGDVYLALYPASSATPTFKVTANTKSYTGTPGASMLSAGSYYRANASSIGGIPVACNTQVVPTGALKGLFSVSATKQVLFSRGNLQYQASTGTWRFAENQYDYIGNAAGNNTAEADRATQSGWIDLFCWGTSGYDNKYPYMFSTTNTDYGNGGNDISGTQYDWGVYCAISNGGNTAGLWRTLTTLEWQYMLLSRSGASSKLGLSTVNGIAGLVVLPDSWTLPSGCTFTEGSGSGYTTNSYTAAQWASMELAGALFLPATGIRNGVSVGKTGTDGWYWSSTTFTTTSACFMTFNSTTLIKFYWVNPGLGLSVRLAQDE